MAKKLVLSFIFLMSVSYMAGVADSATTPDAAASAASANFIKSNCRATRYPDLCVQCLSSYASKIRSSKKELAQAALAVSLARARATAAFVSQMTKVSGMKPREHQAVRDCVDVMGDTVDQLSRSIKELGRIGRGYGEEFTWHVGNVQTWVSAALTNENTCVDGFARPVMDGKVKAAIKTRVVSVAQVTSNALALVNRFAERHRAAAAARATNLP